MTYEQAITEALKRSQIHPNTQYYIFYNDAIFNLDWRNRYQCSEWINRPHDNYKASVLAGKVTKNHEDK